MPNDPMTDDLRAVATELLPCPFCGGRACSFGLTMGNEAIIHCDRCGARITRVRGLEDAAIAAWNRRAAPQLERTLTRCASPTCECNADRVPSAETPTKATFEATRERSFEIWNACHYVGASEASWRMGYVAGYGDANLARPSAPTNERVERAAVEIAIYVNGLQDRNPGKRLTKRDGDVERITAIITEELGRSHKEKV